MPPSDLSVSAFSEHSRLCDPALYSSGIFLPLPVKQGRMRSGFIFKPLKVKYSILGIGNLKSTIYGMKKGLRPDDSIL